MRPAHRSEPLPEPLLWSRPIPDKRFQPFQKADPICRGLRQTTLAGLITLGLAAGLIAPDAHASTQTSAGSQLVDTKQGVAVATPASDEAPGGLELVLDRRQRRLLVLENGQEIRRFPVAVGMPGWETPVGRFEVMELRANPVWEHPANGRLIPPGPANPLGSRWIGFYRDCKGRRGFNGQEHLVVQGCVTAGFHGTPNRASVGQAVSHGCVRLYDEHVQALYNLVQLGTPVTVLP
ncbi:L,D-transpeptidase family protein [Synechococcus sp. CCY9201]|uniref:L,D-transpeptidase family protein n=1 Tax=Synechococcus sp. CCY9201 TaxID=174697 RepID=UPI002B1EA85F|nr:L,D-transpeptidase family protein [Synechococcus sp. CCY9201]MEA5473864.1 L,D-transpeptidase family protein [Synechococcus sp. CCY9201]